MKQMCFTQQISTGTCKLKLHTLDCQEQLQSGSKILRKETEDAASGVKIYQRYQSPFSVCVETNLYRN